MLSYWQCVHSMLLGAMTVEALVAPAYYFMIIIQPAFPWRRSYFRRQSLEHSFALRCVSCTASPGQEWTLWKNIRWSGESRLTAKSSALSSLPKVGQIRLKSRPSLRWARTVTAAASVQSVIIIIIIIIIIDNFCTALFSGVPKLTHSSAVL